MRPHVRSCRARIVATAMLAIGFDGDAGRAASAFGDLLFEDDLELGTLCRWQFPPTGFELPANGLDDDCDLLVDEPDTVCDGGLPTSSSDPLQYAAALHLCQTTTEDGHEWGVISATLSLASGDSAPAAVSRSIRSSLGTGIPSHHGNAFVVLSTGTAAAPGQTNPSHAAFQTGFDTLTQSAAPADWLAANGGSFPNPPGCPETAGTTAHNPVLLTLRIRIPGNARSFRFDANFLSAEYPEWVCSPYNDFFVALLDSGFAGAPANPADKNLAAFQDPGGAIPVGVNLAFGDSGLFTQCLNGTTGCAPGAVVANTNDCIGIAGLQGSGMDTINPPGDPPIPGSCGANNRLGGGTDWLVIRGNVVPGENVTLRLAIWDTSDARWDSVVLLDNFQWSTDLAEPGATRD